MVKKEAKPEPPSEGSDSDQLQDAPSNGHLRTQDLAATENDSQEDYSSSSPAKKRRKLPNGTRQDAGGSGSDSEQENGDHQGELEQEQEQEDSQMDVKPFFMPQRSRDADGFQEGAIVRIKCHNFLTYSDTEVLPGPYLNMIIGPNGTGKSTIVAAISIALGTKAKSLKRHERVSGMVKYGCKDAFVEVEMKTAPGKRNVVVRREINSENNKSVWKLNGRNSSEEEVVEAAAALNVQTDNLVCYLPQELVYEFAKMNGPQLLRATERSAGHRDLPKWHDSLAEVKAEWFNSVARTQEAKEQLSREETNQRHSRREEERLREREAVQREFDFFNVLVPVRTYNERKSAYDGAKARENECKTRLNQLKRDERPYQAEQETQMGKANQLKSAAEEARRALTSLEGKRKRKSDEVSGAEARSSELRDQIENLTNTEKSRQERLRRSRNMIATLENKVKAGPPPSSDVSREMERISQINAERHSTRDRYLEVQERQKVVMDERQEATSDVTRAQREVDNLKNVAAQADKRLADSDRSSFQALEWIRENRASFKARVHDPVRMAVSPKKREYAKYLDAVVNNNAARAIIAENLDDYNLMSRTLNNQEHQGGRNLRLNLSILDASTPALADFEKPWTDEELKSRGFDCWAIDLVEGPDEVLRYLCQVSNLHRIPIATDASRVIDENRLQQRSAPIRRYIANGMNTSFNFSTYGRREIYSSSNLIKEGGDLMFSSGVDPDILLEAERKVQTAKDAVSRIQEALVAMDPEVQELTARSTELSNEKTALLDVRKEKEALNREYEQAKTRLDAERGNLRRIESQPTQTDERKRLMTALKTQADKRLKLVESWENLCYDILGAQTRQTNAELAYLHADANVKALKAQASEVDIALREVQNEYRQAKAEVGTLLDNAKEALEQYRSVLAEYGGNFEEERATFDEENPDITLDELESLLAEKEAALQAAPEISSTVVQQIRKRESSIKRLQAIVEKGEEAGSKLERRIAKIEGRYKPIMQAVVKEVNEKFSNAFESMGCLGEVQMDDSDPDPNLWAIRILVSFRQGTELVELSGQRQSGGERSLTTIMYLISLTKVSTAPFSLVDEINQGMDARNERAVLDLLVKCTCEEDASQYFLITPKLLPALRYHERMKILCIQNGDFLPEEGFSPAKWLKTAKRQRRER